VEKKNGRRKNRTAKKLKKQSANIVTADNAVTIAPAGCISVHTTAQDVKKHEK